MAVDISPWNLGTTSRYDSPWPLNLGQAIKGFRRSVTMRPMPPCDLAPWGKRNDDDLYIYMYIWLIGGISNYRLYQYDHIYIHHIDHIICAYWPEGSPNLMVNHHFPHDSCLKMVIYPDLIHRHIHTHRIHVWYICEHLGYIDYIDGIHGTIYSILGPLWDINKWMCIYIYTYIYVAWTVLNFLAIFLWVMIREFHPWISLGNLGLAMYLGQSWES